MKGVPLGRPRVSVVTPFLNTSAQFFREAVSSVQSQTFTDWELVLVNDGSGPEATLLARELAESAPSRIRCMSHPGGVNRGIAASRNLGVAHTSGEYIAFLDSDDVWFPNKLAEQVTIMDAEPDVSMIFGRSVYWHSWRSADAPSQDSTPRLGVSGRTKLHPPEFLYRFLRWRVIVPCPSSILVRTSAFHAVGGFDDRLPNTYEDQGFYTKIALAGVVMACDAVWDQYRIHAGSVVQSAGRRQSLQERRAFLTWVEEYTAAQGHHDPGLMRTLKTERLALSVHGAPRVLRFLRRVAALPERLRNYLRECAATR